MVRYRYKEFKTILNKMKYPDSWFWAKYTINPYSGCQHACIYCDARSDRYFLQQNFEDEIIIKTNADKMLDLRIKRARNLLPDVVGPGGVNDAYQPIEKKVENTRKILQVLAKHKFPLNIATKSKLIIRDLNVLKKIAGDSWCTIGFSITTTNEDLAKFLEPYSSKPSERLEALKTIKNEAPNIQVGTYFIPIIPFLEDSENNMEDVIRKSKEAGADFLLFSPGLTMRDSQAEFFLKKLKDSKFSSIVKPLLNLYRGQMQPPSDYVKSLHLKLLYYCQKYDLAIRVKRWIPSDYRKWNYKISEMLLNKEYTDSLKTGRHNRNMMWAGLNLNNLRESIMDVYKRGELSKLQNFKQEVIDLVKPYLDKTEDLKQRIGLDKFL
ncbi:MAG: Radical SAM superfamily protein [Candidatus Lokiarchaeum sp. GC14_75]|nr:MAG: Radical SAM superfamily protein [Candidatus Lokiarchaeum sp. GC14_75]